MNNNKILDFGEINARALEYAAEIFDEIGLEGEMQGNEYVVINPTRDDVELGSFKFNMASGAWADFAGDDNSKGGDLISYVAYVSCTPICQCGAVSCHHASW